ncbi:hypothetical protein [Litoreibacter roseus]|nr:hypothetical protein [Litoreibacter roseus]
MAHYKRKRSRLKGRNKGYSAKGLERRLKVKAEDLRWLQNYPRWHDKLHHIRPSRRAERKRERELLKGIDPDNLAWPVSRKPHHYFW